MHLCLLLLPITQPGYEHQVLCLAEQVEQIMGAEAFAGAAVVDVPNRIVAAFASPVIPGASKLQLADALRCFTWWCGLELAPAVLGGIGRMAREVLADQARGLLSRRRPISPTTPVHNLFVGALVGPLHSPSRGAVDYARALARLPWVERVNLCHTGPVAPAMLAHLEDGLGEAAARVGLTPVGASAAWLQACTGEGVNHVWCDASLAAHIAFASRLGPTLMFTCGDAPPFQYADVYWFYREPDYIAELWGRCGVPADMIANYICCDAGPNDDRLRPRRRLSKADLGLQVDDLVLATVGNRLAVDLDQPFVNGVEAALRTHPRARWLVVGALPEPLVAACRAVLGERFLHRAFEPDLPSLMTAVDIFLNPFRQGGGDSAMRALSSGALVLSRGDKGDVAALTPARHRQPDAPTYFATLDALLAQPDLRRTWAVEQARKAERLADQDVFAAELRRMIDCACERWNHRTSRPEPRPLEPERLVGAA
jgi:hypothetical protein